MFAPSAAVRGAPGLQGNRCRPEPPSHLADPSAVPPVAGPRAEGAHSCTAAAIGIITGACENNGVAGDDDYCQLN